MGNQPPALEKLFDEWSKKHAENLSTAAPYCLPEQEQPYGGFVRDGIIDLESWKKQKVRICFILNEAGGRFDETPYPDGHDLAAEWNEKGSFSKFMFKLSVWTKAIQDAFAPPSTYKKSEVVKIRDELIRSIAVVNIKKSDGRRHSDFELLQRFANEDADELRRELEIVNPNIIICCENLRFLREPLPIPPNKKFKKKKDDAENAETSDTAVSEVTVAEVAPAETVPAETAPVESAPVESETAVAEGETAPVDEANKLNYVFHTKDLIHLSKFTYLWGSKLVFSFWTPANFIGTISSNTMNYYAVREVVRAALKAFGERQKNQKIKALNEQRHQEKLKKKLENQQKKEAAAQAKAENPAPAETPATAPAPAETPAPAKVEAPAEVKAEAPAKPKTTRKTKAATAEPAPAATAETPAAKPRTRKTAAKPKTE